jgi:methyl-accepting chemotaxis protein
MEQTSVQTHALSEASESLSHINQFGSEVKSTIHQVSGATDSVFVASIEGRNSAAELGKTLTQLSNSAEAVTRVEALLQSMNRNIDLIQNIVRKTELLSFNASIEAARSGEHGRGFSVVAEEVATLASQSKEASEMIYESITQVQEEIHALAQVIHTNAIEGTRTGNSFLSTFKSIAEKIERIKGETERSVSTTESQNQQIEMGNQIMSKLKTTTLRGKEISQSINQLGRGLSSALTELKQTFQETQKILKT